MAGAHLKVDVDTREIFKAFSALLASTADPTPAYRDIGEMLLRSHEDRFTRQVDPQGRPWQPLSEEYKKKKPRNKGKILTLYGHLRRLVYQASSSGLEFGTPWLYGATHQFGDPLRGIPARPFLGMTEKDQADSLQILGDHVLRLRG